jgi:hypothetical protein
MPLPEVHARRPEQGKQSGPPEPKGAFGRGIPAKGEGLSKLSSLKKVAKRNFEMASKQKTLRVEGFL